MKSHEITAASSPLNLYVDGELKEFTAHPFSDKDYDEMDLWIQTEVVRIARTSAQQSLDDKEITIADYNRDVSLAQKAAISVSIYTPEGSQIVNTPRGLARLAWQMTKKGTFTDFLPLCRYVENVDAIIATFYKLNGNMSEDSEGNE